MADSSKTCYLFTHHFPYEEGEVFIEKEIPFLASCFQKVVIFPLALNIQQIKNLPSNVSAEYLFANQVQEYKPGNILLRNFFLFSQLLLSEFIAHPRITMLQLRNLASDLLQQFYRAEILHAYLKEKNTSNTFFYSFWFDRWALILSLTRSFGKKVKFNFVSRAHGYEIFRDQTRFGYHPFKKFMLSKVVKVFTVSKHGMNYLREYFPQFKEKIDCAYLGTADRGLNPVSSSVFHIVSCANVRELKRLDKVCDILKHLAPSLKVKWTLIGDGADLEMVKQKAVNLPGEIECHFTGHLSAEEIIKFYSETPVDLFLSVSRTEGLPFTMIEAISFGIPLMSTDVGGCSEITTEQTGILIEKEFDPKTVALKIVEFNSSKNNTEFRKGVRKFWEENFKAERNYLKFYERNSKTEN